MEDEPELRALCVLVLERAGGWRVDLCANGHEALERTEAFAPDFILLDVMTPGIYGPEALEPLRAIPALAATPAAFMTAKARRHEIDELLACGALDMFVKPFEPMTLCGRIQAVCARRPNPRRRAVFHNGSSRRAGGTRLTRRWP